MQFGNNKKSRFFLSILSFVLIILVGCYWNIQRSPKYFTSDNFLIVDGKPFFPIGIYSVNPLKRWDPPFAFEEIKTAGFNTVHTYESKGDYLKEYVKHAETVGLKILIHPGNYLGNPKFDIDNVKNIVKDIGGSSAILAWYLCDEPELQKVSPGKLIEEMNLVHELDSFHPVAIVLAKPNKFDDCAEATHIFMVDPYPVPHRPLVEVAQTVDAARKAVGDKKPVWAILQAFGYQNEKNRGWGWKREPTYQEMRAMTYLAIVRGVQGIFYYTYHGSQYFIKDSPVHWEALKTIVNELSLIYPILISPGKKEFMLSLSSAKEGRQSLFSSVRDVRYGNKIIEAGTYLLVVNGAENRITATFASDQIKFSKIKVIFEDREIMSNDGKFSDFFDPYGIPIYYLKE